jgi:hypothetical protein
MNTKWKKQRPAPADGETQVIRCSGPELPLVLAKLRRAGLSHTEPMLEPDARTAEVLPNGQVQICGQSHERKYVIRFGSGGNRSPVVAEDDHGFHFRSFDQGARGSMTLDY